ncbi:hypothetical protein QYE76_071499 [Lolium multiflorum]|uniref:Uncharacterized protein n=1 Tax=Lolium multiflorum TaxID=4521 RepID=A0AAD8SLA6_LOLMU|nr:hypothetical protein QYE76_071499 [Lolium multiflorum]
MAPARRGDEDVDEVVGMQHGAISTTPARCDDDLDEVAGAQRGAILTAPARRDDDDLDARLPMETFELGRRPGCAARCRFRRSGSMGGQRAGDVFAS